MISIENMTRVEIHAKDSISVGTNGPAARHRVSSHPKPPVKKRDGFCVTNLVLEGEAYFRRGQSETSRSPSFAHLSHIEVLGLCCSLTKDPTMIGTGRDLYHTTPPVCAITHVRAIPKLVGPGRIPNNQVIEASMVCHHNLHQLPDVNLRYPRYRTIPSSKIKSESPGGFVQTEFHPIEFTPYTVHTRSRPNLEASNSVFVVMEYAGPPCHFLSSTTTTFLPRPQFNSTTSTLLVCYDRPDAGSVSRSCDPLSHGFLKAVARWSSSARLFSQCLTLTSSTIAPCFPATVRSGRSHENSSFPDSQML